MGSILVAVVAASVAVFGYLYVQVGGRRERLGKTFADALSAVADLQGSPFLIRRRSSSSPETRWEMARIWHGIHARLDFHLAWMRVDAANVSKTYADLVELVRELSGEYTDWALQQEPFETDADVVAHLAERFTYPGVDLLTAQCVEEMRVYLRRPWFQWR